MLWRIAFVSLVLGLSWVFLLGALPLINYVQSFGTSRLAEPARQFAEEGADRIVESQQWVGGAIVAVLLILSVLMASRSTGAERGVLLLFWSSLLGFLLLSHVRKAVFWVGFAGQYEQAIYWLILAVLILAYAAQRQYALMDTMQTGLVSRELWLLILLVIVIPLVLALVSVQLHDGLPGAQQRF